MRLSQRVNYISQSQISQRFNIIDADYLSADEWRFVIACRGEFCDRILSVTQYDTST